MTSQAIAFEHPLNERIRTFLRLEHLFDKIDYCVAKSEEWATRTAIETLIDLLSIPTATEIKPEILQEIERYIAILEPLEQQAGVDSDILNQYLDDLRTAMASISRLEENTNQLLYENEFLKLIMRRRSLPAGSCSFDLPHYSYWLKQSLDQHQQQINLWMQDLLPIRDGVRILLSLARNSCDPKPIVAHSGLYQHALDAKLPIQMLRIQIEEDLALFPEVSGYKHHFNIQFMEVQNTERPIPTERDVNFLLTCCVF